MQLPGGWFLNNAGWVTGADRTLLVDTCATEARSRRLLDAARAAAPAGTPLTAVLAHAHGDHANGAGLVARTGGAVLTSPPAAEEIAAGPHTHPTLFDCPEHAWGDIAPPPSTDTVTAASEVDLGGRVAEVVPVPGRAHTDDDLVVWLPHDGVLFTGDLLFTGVTPLALQGSVPGWLDALRWLPAFEARWIVPGHGPVAEAGSGALAELTGYLQWVVDTVADTGDPDFDGLERQARQRWPHWLDAERHAVNPRMAHAETHGRPAPLVAALEAMLRSAGGRIALDLAL